MPELGKSFPARSLTPAHHRTASAPPPDFSIGLPAPLCLGRPVRLPPHPTSARPTSTGRKFDLLKPKHLKTLIMGGLLYIIAVILIILWAIGYFGYHAGGIIHALLVIAIIAILLRVIRSAD